MKNQNFTVSWIKAGILEMKNQLPIKKSIVFSFLQEYFGKIPRYRQAKY